uniref:Uncharacterized protein ycf33 n=1 Tax=Kumanoa americana TaxID=1196377 RepID=A0A1C9CGU1_9FLOR|nr:hypothetical protein Kuma_160 [Kumanoa americana]AOM67594.1 hypothetical protein Kuma_160 [Kumanoa americana]
MNNAIMSTWKNFSQFIKFLISVLVGFFLTTFYSIFKLSKNQKIRWGIYLLITTMIVFLYYTLKFMLGYTG